MLTINVHIVSKKVLAVSVDTYFFIWKNIKMTK